DLLREQHQPAHRGSEGDRLGRCLRADPRASRRDSGGTGRGSEHRMTSGSALAPDLTPILSAFEDLRGAPNRLVLLVGPHGSGKTRHLMALEAARGYRRVALGAPVAEQLRELPSKRRPGRV